jgi:hypothetical protein
MAKPINSTNLSSIIPAGSDYIVLGGSEHFRTVCLVFGRTGVGKTHFGAFFTPDPIAFISFDSRSERTVKKAVKAGRRIIYTQIESPDTIARLAKDEAMKVARDQVRRVVKNHELAVAQAKKGLIRTICYDTGTEFSELLSIAARGIVGGRANDFGDSKNLINQAWRRLLAPDVKKTVNIVILARSKAIWADNAPTGDFTYRGNETMDEAADWAAEIRVKRNVGKKGEAAKLGWDMLVTKAGENIGELGAVYTQGDWGKMGPFAFACLMQYEESQIEDWR